MDIMRYGRTSGNPSAYVNARAEIVVATGEKDEYKAVAHADISGDMGFERGTKLRISIKEGEIRRLLRDIENAKAKRLADNLQSAEKERDTLQTRVSALEKSISHISNLAGYGNWNAPNADVLLKAVQEMAEHYRWHCARPFHSRRKWLAEWLKTWQR